MDKDLTGKLVDCSNNDEFQFSVECDICKNVWNSTQVKFTYRNVLTSTDGRQKIFNLLHQEEHQAAFNRAAQEAVQYFSLCPMCRRWACDDCFQVCEYIDLCVECANELGECGITVREKKMREC